MPPKPLVDTPTCSFEMVHVLSWDRVLLGVKWSLWEATSWLQPFIINHKLNVGQFCGISSSSQVLIPDHHLLNPQLGWLIYQVFFSLSSHFWSCGCSGKSSSVLEPWPRKMWKGGQLINSGSLGLFLCVWFPQVTIPLYPSIINQKTNQGQHFWVPLNSHCLRKSFWRRLAPTMPQSLHLGYGKAALQNVPPSYEYVCPNPSKQLTFLWLVSKIGHVKEEKLSPAKNEVFGRESFAMTCFMQMPFFLRSITWVFVFVMLWISSSYP